MPEIYARALGLPTAEEVLDVARQRFNPKSDDPFEPAPGDDAEPTGEPFDETTLAARYPRLARATRP